VRGLQSTQELQAPLHATRNARHASPCWFIGVVSGSATSRSTAHMNVPRNVHASAANDDALRAHKRASLYVKKGRYNDSQRNTYIARVTAFQRPEIETCGVRISREQNDIAE